MTDILDLTDVRVRIALPPGRTAPDLSDYLANNAVANVRDFGALGDDRADDTTAFRAAARSVASGGTLLIPRGRYRLTDEIILGPGTEVVGSGSADFAYGATPNATGQPTYVWQSTPGRAIFVVHGAAHSVHIHDLSLGVASHPSQQPVADERTGIRVEGSYPDFLWSLRFDRLTFYNFRTAISCIDPRAGRVDKAHPYDWSVAPVSVEDCRFYYPHVGIHLDTNNADDWVVDRCAFFVAQGGDGIFLRRSGFIRVANSFGGGEVAEGNRLLHIRGNGPDALDNVILDNCQAETLACAIQLDAESTHGMSPFVLTVRNSIAEMGAGVRLGSQCRFISENNRWFAELRVEHAAVRLVSILDRFGPEGRITYTAGSASECMVYLLPGPDASPALANDFYVGGRLTRFASSAPAHGSYAVGDVVRNSAPVKGASSGWICVGGGSPGTWQSLAVIGQRVADAVPHVSLPDASDLGSAIVLANELKKSLNLLLAARHAAGESV